MPNIINVVAGGPPAYRTLADQFGNEFENVATVSVTLPNNSQVAKVEPDGALLKISGLAGGFVVAELTLVDAANNVIGGLNLPIAVATQLVVGAV